MPNVTGLTPRAYSAVWHRARVWAPARCSAGGNPDGKIKHSKGYWMHKGCASLQLALHLPSARSHSNLVTINELKHGALATACLFAAKPCRFNNPIIVYVPNCISRFNNWYTERLWKKLLWSWFLLASQEFRMGKERVNQWCWQS